MFLSSNIQIKINIKKIQKLISWHNYHHTHIGMMYNGYWLKYIFQLWNRCINNDSIVDFVIFVCYLLSTIPEVVINHNVTRRYRLETLHCSRCYYFFASESILPLVRLLFPSRVGYQTSFIVENTRTPLYIIEAKSFVVP